MPINYSFLKKKNNSKSTLSSNLSGAAITCLVTSLATFPPSPSFLCTIWNKTSFPDPSDDIGAEIVKVTAISSGSTFTITRAQNGTLARAHVTGDAIELLVTTALTDEYETQINTKPDCYRTSFTNSSLQTKILPVSHNLGQQYVHVHVYDNNNKYIVPDNITLNNTIQLDVDLTSYAPLSGTWNIIVSG